MSPRWNFKVDSKLRNLRAVLEMNVPLESAVRAASENPAKSIGIDNDYGSLAAGRYGNVILADKELNIQAVYQKGTRIV